MLIDTHALIWLFAGDERLGLTACRCVEAVRRDGSLLVSPISFFETATLVRRERIDLGIPLDDWIESVVRSRRVSLAPIDIGIARAAGLLPDAIHGDPADRLLIATARHLGMPLLTADRLILEHAAAGHLQAIDARH